MPLLKIAIGSIKYDLECQENEQKIIKEIARKINKKINLLSLEIGRINEKILLLALLIINTKKIEKVKGKNFEDIMMKVLKVIAPFLSAKNDKDLTGNLIVSNIMKESELANITNESDLSNEMLESNSEKNFDKETHYKEMIDLIDNLDKLINSSTENEN